MNFPIQSFSIIIFASILFFYIGFIFPILRLMECARNTQLTKSKSFFWMSLQLIAWPIGGFLYSFYNSPKRITKWSAALFLILSLIFTFGIYKIPKIFKSYYIAEIHRLTQESSLQGKPIIPRLTEIETELMKTKWHQIQKALVLINLIDILKSFIGDGALQDQEIQTWLGLFDSRNNLQDHQVNDLVKAFIDLNQNIPLFRPIDITSEKVE